MDNISLAKSAWSVSTESTAENHNNRKPLFDILDENVVLKFSVPDGTPISGEFRGRKSVIDFYTVLSPEIAADGRMNGPLRFGSIDNRVVILGTESYKIAKSGVDCRNKEFAIVLDFRDGLITRILQIKDFTELVDAYLAN